MKKIKKKLKCLTLNEESCLGKIQKEHEKQLYLINSKKHLDNYYKAINSTCTNICNSCEGLRFDHSVKKYSVDKLMSLMKSNTDKILSNEIKKSFLQKTCRLNDGTNQIILCSICDRDIKNYTVNIHNLIL